MEANCSYEVGYSSLSASMNFDEIAASHLHDSNSAILMNKHGESAKAKKFGAVSTCYPQKEGAGRGDTAAFNHPFGADIEERTSSPGVTGGRCVCVGSVGQLIKIAMLRVKNALPF
jgi:hypothetical protein